MITREIYIVVETGEASSWCEREREKRRKKKKEEERESTGGVGAHDGSLEFDVSSHWIQ